MPCMFYALVRARPPVRVPTPKAAATIAPLISAMPAASAQDKVTWIWDTGAGRHLVGKQATSAKAHHLILPILVIPMQHHARDADARSSTEPAPHMAAARGAVGVKINVGAAFAQCSSKCKCTSLAQSTKASKAPPCLACVQQLATLIPVA